ncbi:MAG: type VI secretion protein IcmF/TssM N-terminal domain-containing protein [Rhodothermaceae bacterium]
MSSINFTGKENLIKHFYKFYVEVKKIKENCDFSVQENLQVVQTELMKLLNQHSLNFQNCKTINSKDPLSEALYLLTIYTDELFIDTVWEGERIWEDHLLEEQLFDSHVSGIKFFDNLDNIIKEKEINSNDISMLYLLMIAGGFKGQFMHNDKDNKLYYYRTKLFSMLYNCSPFVLDEIHHLFPETYNATFTRGKKIFFYNLRRVCVIGGIVLVFTLLRLIYYLYTDWCDRVIDKIFSFYSSHVVLIFILLLLSLLAILGYIIWLHFRRKQLFFNQRKKYTRFEIRESVEQLLALLKERIGRRGYKYKLPWYLMLGGESAGGSTLLKEMTLRKTSVNYLKETGNFKKACNWWVFERGVVLDVSSDLDLSDETNKLWKYLVRKIKNIRRLRPLDGIIIPVPADLFFLKNGNKADNIDKIKEEADLLSERLDYLQKKFKMQLPVYIIITKSDYVDGFKDFVNELPERFSNELFGWSNPYRPEIYTYSRSWISEAFSKINEQLSFLQFGIINNSNGRADKEKIFLFSRQIDTLKYPVQIFANRLFKNEEYSNLAPILLRGVYFCGYQNDEIDQTDANKRVFVQDIFDKKIFNEPTLAEPMKKIIFY